MIHLYPGRMSPTTKDMIISFARQTRRSLSPSPVLTTVKGAGTELMEKLCFESHVASMLKKIHLQLFYLDL